MSAPARAGTPVVKGAVKLSPLVAKSMAKAFTPTIFNGSHITMSFPIGAPSATVAPVLHAGFIKGVNKAVATAAEIAAVPRVYAFAYPVPMTSTAKMYFPFLTLAPFVDTPVAPATAMAFRAISAAGVLFSYVADASAAIIVPDPLVLGMGDWVFGRPSSASMEHLEGVLVYAMFYDRPLYDYELRATYTTLKNMLQIERSVALP